MHRHRVLPAPRPPGPLAQHPPCPSSAPRAKATDRGVLEVVKAVVGQDEPAPLPRLHPASWEQREPCWALPGCGTARPGPRGHTQASSGRRGASRARQPRGAGAQQQQAAHSTPGSARARAESRRMGMEAEGGGRAEPGRECGARSHRWHRAVPGAGCSRGLRGRTGLPPAPAALLLPSQPNAGQSRSPACRSWAAGSSTASAAKEELLPCARGLLPAEPGSPPPRSGRHSGTGCSAQRHGLGTQAMLLRVGTGAKQQGVHNGLVSPTPSVSAGQPCLAAPPCHLTSQPFTWPSQSPLLGKVHPSPCPTARLRPGFPRRTRLPALLQPSPPLKPLGSMPPSPQPS